MSELAYAKDFRELVVYQKARAVAGDVFRLSAGFPPEERYSLTSQSRGSSRSVGAQIAEAWAKRRYPKHFVTKLTDADGEQLETQHWMEVAVDCGYLEPEKASAVIARLAEIGRMLNSMMLKSELFCQEDTRQVHETAATYFVMDGESADATLDR